MSLLNDTHTPDRLFLTPGVRQEANLRPKTPSPVTRSTRATEPSTPAPASTYELVDEKLPSVSSF